MKFASHARTPQETQTEQDHSAAPLGGSEDLLATGDNRRADTCTHPPEAPTPALTTQTKQKSSLLQRMRAVSDPEGSLALLDFGEERQTSNARRDFPLPMSTRAVGPKSVHRPNLTASGEAGAAGDEAGLLNSACPLLVRLRSAPSNDVATSQIVADITPGLVEVAVDNDIHTSSLHDHRKRFTTNRGRTWTRSFLLESKVSRVARNDQGPATSSPDDSALQRSRKWQCAAARRARHGRRHLLQRHGFQSDSRCEQWQSRWIWIPEQFNGAEQKQMQTSGEWMRKKHKHRARTRAKEDRGKWIQSVWHPSDPILPGEAVGKSTCRAAVMAPARRVGTTRIGSGSYLYRENYYARGQRPRRLEA